MNKWKLPWVARREFEGLELALQDAKTYETSYNLQFVAHDKTRQQRDEYKRELNTANARLTRIIALETPSAAHGVRKAVAIARGEA